MKPTSLLFWLACLAMLSSCGKKHDGPFDQIDVILARPAVSEGTWTILVKDQDGKTCYEHNSRDAAVPASTLKLFTASAAFGLLGTNHCFETRVYFDGSCAEGVLAGDINLVAEHDITWNTTVFPSNPRAPLDYIASQLKAKGLKKISGKVQGYGACFYNHEATDVMNDSEDQHKYNAEAAAAFASALSECGIMVSSNSAFGQSGFTVPGTLIYTYKSSELTYNGTPLYLDTACIPMLKNSNNMMADALLRHLGYKLKGIDSFSAGASQILPWLSNEAGISVKRMIMKDGSGLSHDDACTPEQVVSLLQFMLANYPTFSRTLPIACSDGTLAERFCGTDAAGKVHAKTGSLSVSAALSGYTENKNSGKRYTFSFISNNPKGTEQLNARQSMDDAVVFLTTFQ